MEQAIARQDVGALMALCFQQRGDTRALVQLDHDLRQAALYEPWLQVLLDQRLQHCWFIAFKYQEPRELLTAFEYDDLVRHTPPPEERTPLRRDLEKCVDRALCVRYYGQYGVQLYRARQIYGRQLFEVLPTQHRAESLLGYASADERPAIDDTLLNPTRDRWQEWTCFHLRMRRMAFRMLLRLCGWLGRGNEAERALCLALAELYGDTLRNRVWRDATTGEIVSLGDALGSVDEERVLDFFAPTDEFWAQARPAHDFPALLPDARTWRQETRDAWAQVRREISGAADAAPWTTLFWDADADSSFVVDGARYAFIYEPESACSRQAFHQRLLDHQK